MVTNDNWSSLINTVSGLINLSFHLSTLLAFPLFARMFDSPPLPLTATITFDSDSTPAYAPEFEI